MNKTTNVFLAPTILDALDVRADRFPTRLAYRVGGREVSYGRLRAEVSGVAQVLWKCGLRPGDRCALVLPTGLDFPRAAFAVQRVGATPVALSPSTSPGVLLRQQRYLRCTLMIVEEAVAARLESVGAHSNSLLTVDGLRNPPSTDFSGPGVCPEDVAYIQMTSGTTGEPKGAMISHRSLVASLQSAMENIAIRDDDVLVSWLPHYHDFGIVRFIFGPIYFGCPVHLIPPSLMNLRDWLFTISRVRGTITGSPDFGYRMAVKLSANDDVDLSSLRLAGNGGEPVRGRTIEQFERRFGLRHVVRPGYGLAEATLTVTSEQPGAPIRLDAAGNVSCGRPMRGIEVKIVDSKGMEVSPGQSGEILVRGEPVFSGYFDDPTATDKILRDGWLHTGDLGALDRENHLYVLGRSRNMIKTAGAMIAPREVEEAVESDPEVRISAAVGVPNETLGGTEALIVVVEIPRQVAATESVRASLSRRISAKVKETIGIRPWNVLLVPPKTIPTTHNGKIRHGELRDQVAAGKVVDQGTIRYELKPMFSRKSGCDGENR